MKILVGHEKYQEVCKAFRALGHEAFSCDLLPCRGDHPEWHMQLNVLEAMARKEWDMFIGFPDCTYVAVSGLHWNGRVPGRSEKTEAALQHVCDMLNTAKFYGIPKVGFENPVGCISTRVFMHPDGRYKVFPKPTRGALKPTQSIQPYQFGEDASKRTCLWLFNLPALQPTKYIEPRMVGNKKRWANQTDSGQNKLPPSEDRAAIRGKTYPGIAAAMADQWGSQLDIFHHA